MLALGRQTPRRKRMNDKKKPPNLLALLPQRPLRQALHLVSRKMTSPLPCRRNPGDNMTGEPPIARGG